MRRIRNNKISQATKYFLEICGFESSNLPHRLKSDRRLKLKKKLDTVKTLTEEEFASATTKQGKLLLANI